jgi:hypothetical protein
MQYKVVPFTARLTQKDTTQTVAQQLEALIQKGAEQGWDYVRLESVETIIQGNGGCFGFGATPDRTTFFKMIVFSKP